MKTKELHRGAADDPVTFATRFLEARLAGFEKDMRICLTGHPSRDRVGPTHAYFPALMNCCATLEYLVGFHRGDVVTACGVNEFKKYGRRFLPKPDYTDDVIHVLVDVFRHRVAHHGIASGVWKSRYPLADPRRITWTLEEFDRRPALQVVEDPGIIESDSPWRCRYTHRAYIYLDRLWRDIRDSVTAPGGYIEALAEDPNLVTNFDAGLRQLYPR